MWVLLVQIPLRDQLVRSVVALKVEVTREHTRRFITRKALRLLRRQRGVIRHHLHLRIPGRPALVEEAYGDMYHV